MSTVGRQSEWKPGTMTKYYSNTTMNLSLSTPALENYKDTRESERKEMQNLNSRLEQYIERSRDKLDYNQELKDILKNLKNNIIKEVKSQEDIYEPEMEQLRCMLDDVENENNELKLNRETNEALRDDLLNRIDEYEDYNKTDQNTMKKLDNLIHSAAQKLKNLEHKLSSLELDGQKEKDSINQLRSEIADLEKELNGEILLKAYWQNKAQSCAETMKFSSDIYNKEMQQLSGLNDSNLFDPYPEFWNEEFSNCIETIRSEYEALLEEVRGQMDNSYNLKISEVQESSLQSMQMGPMGPGGVTEMTTMNSEIENQIDDLNEQNNLLKNQKHNLEDKIKQLKDNLSQLNAEKEAELFEMQIQLAQYSEDLKEVIKGNESYQMEIILYKALLESEENRMGVLQNQDVQLEAAPPPMINPRKVVTFKRSGSGPIIIHDVDTEGFYIVIENTDSQAATNLENWQIVQIVDGRKEYVHTFEKYVFYQGLRITIWVEGCSPVSENDIVLTNTNLIGVGETVVTILLNPEGREKYRFTQKITFK